MDRRLEKEFWSRRCRDSFWWFFNYAWGARFNPEGSFVDASIHKPMCDWFQSHVEDWMPKRGTKDAYRLNLAILVPRRVGKSTIFTQAGMLWLHLLDPNLATYIGGHNTEFATEFLPPLKSVMDGSDPYARFAWLYGNWYNPARTWKTDQLIHGARQNTTRREPSFGTFGVETGLVGKHPDVIDIDDPTSYEKMGSHFNWLQTVNNHIVSLEPVIEADGMMMWVGTRYADGDHFGHYFKKEGVRTVTGQEMPYIAPSPEGKWHVYYLSAKDKSGEPAIPSVWSKKGMEDFERQDPLRAASQLYNDPRNSVFTPLTRAQIDSYLCDDKDIPWKMLSYTIHMDTAFKDQNSQAKGDESVIQLWGHYRDGSGNVVFAGGWGSHLWRVEQFTDRLIKLVQECRTKGWRIRLMTDETEVGGKLGTWEMALRSAFANASVIMPPLVILKHGNKKKINRIIAATSYWIDGHVRLPRNSPGLGQLVEQMSSIGTSAHDDWSDTQSSVFAKDIYSTMHRVQQPDEADVANPFDTVLKDGDARVAMYRYYDQYAVPEPIW